MKNYFTIILLSAILLLIFPFLAFPELWENIYVSVLSFIIGYTALLFRHKCIKDDDDESSLQEYVQELKERFKEDNEILKKKNDIKRISEINIDEK